MLAAEVAAAAISGNNFSADYFYNNYNTVLFTRIGDELKLSLTMKKLVSYL